MRRRNRACPSRSVDRPVHTRCQLRRATNAHLDPCVDSDTGGHGQPDRFTCACQPHAARADAAR